jgi:hypothetical protein
MSRAHNPMDPRQRCATPIHHGLGGGAAARLTEACAPKRHRPRNLSAKVLKRRREQGGPHHGVGR